MSPPKSLCLNMIVKNETANLGRCLASVAPHIACWVIGDTGSTDGTQDFIRRFFAERGIPGELHDFPFIDFEQARNAALDAARASPLAFDYLLFTDADMELVVEDSGFRERLEAPGYTLIQRAGISYANGRLARRDSGVRYRGVTHEYLDVPSGTQPMDGLWFIDHATGSNRVDKFERDIRLLKAGLDREPDNGRYWFYLAQSYRDSGRKAEAVEAYAKRARMGGWAEEAWHAQLSQARCLLDLGDEAGFTRAALAAFDRRPHRAEPLYDLARFHRERGQNQVAVMYAEAGLTIPYPASDLLFIEDFVYRFGLREELSIAGFYSADPARRDNAFAVCDDLALDRSAPDHQRHLARSNLRFFARPLAEIAPSFEPSRVAFTPPDGWTAMNPSIARQGGQLVVSQRVVNYQVPKDGGPYTTRNGEEIGTRNFLLRLNDDLSVASAREVLEPADMPPPNFDKVRGFEDPRLFAWRGSLWCLSNVREFSPEGWCQQVLARIDETGDRPCRLVDWRILPGPNAKQHEKNWMPMLEGDRLRFIYHCDPTRLVDETGRATAVTTPTIAGEDFRGGSQAVAFDGGWLTLIHEMVTHGPWSRSYTHRFIGFSHEGVLQTVSRPFVFHERGLEFAAGLAWRPDEARLVISYGAGDSQAWLATIDPADVRALLAVPR
jgi:tetratricopeptide (TPR) repeat protein